MRRSIGRLIFKMIITPRRLSSEFGDKDWSCGNCSRDNNRRDSTLVTLYFRMYFVSQFDPVYPFPVFA